MSSVATTAPNNPAAQSARQVAWMFELAVQPGRDADFRALMTEMADSAERNEPGTLDYEWFVTDDGARLHLWERYVDADAAMLHLGTFESRFMARFFGVLTPERITLYGAPDERVRGAMTDLAPVVMARAAGFSR